MIERPQYTPIFVTQEDFEVKDQTTFTKYEDGTDERVYWVPEKGYFQL